MLSAPEYPQFQCPNCRAMADLEADVDEPPSDFEDDWEEAPIEAEENSNADNRVTSSVAGHPAISAQDDTDEGGGDGANDDGQTVLASQLEGLRLSETLGSPPPDTTLHMPGTSPVPIGSNLSVPANMNGRTTPPRSATQFALAGAETVAPDGPMTPRNDAGPFILDGSAGRSERRTGMGNLESVVHEEE